MSGMTENWEDAKEYQGDSLFLSEQVEEEFVDAPGTEEDCIVELCNLKIRDPTDDFPQECTSGNETVLEENTDPDLLEGLVVSKDDIEMQLKDAVLHKESGNKEFGKAEYEVALDLYREALAACVGKPSLDRIASEEPTLVARVERERAVINANMAAAFMKQEKWDQAVSHASSSIASDVNYIKAYMRRAQSYEKLGDSTSLAGALKDYEMILTLDSTNLPALDGTRRLPAAIQVKQDQEKDEMMLKLKDVGNLLLGKFGLSTDNFQFVKDPSTGGYSMNFKQ